MWKINKLLSIWYTPRAWFVRPEVVVNSRWMIFDVGPIQFIWRHRLVH